MRFLRDPQTLKNPSPSGQHANKKVENSQRRTNK
jgi:hypothetical protein